jgi:hypothetical protein
MKEFNLFETELSWNDEHRRVKEIRTTRICSLFLIINLTILISFTSISTETKYISISYPSQTIFNQLRLNSLYSTLLECPCQNIVVQVILLIEILDGLICFIHHMELTKINPYDDFRLFALSQFRTLALLRILDNQTWTQFKFIRIGNIDY